ncbi:MAG: hypothetical protein JNN11_00330 [Candidatus Doudnabacteria bacterium]|nr:hypothetical protein [Candidatus Doudnabacteria bacterium]
MFIKKLLFFLSIIAVLGAGCGLTQQTQKQSIVNQNASTTPEAMISNVLPSGSIFTQGEGADIPLSWSVLNPPTNATIYLRLLSSNGEEALGSITNNSDCSKGGDATALANSKTSFKWDGLLVCSNWQTHSVKPGDYKLGIQLYSANGNNIITAGQSAASFKIQK